MSKNQRNYIKGIISKKLSTASLILFLRQFGVLLRGDLPIIQSLFILCESGADPSIRKAAASLHERISSGELLSIAMRNTGFFPPIFVAMVNTAEESGSLSTVIENYGKTTERNYELRKKVQTAFIYPIILSIVSIIVLIFLLLNVIPSFVRLFSESQVVLPLPTRILIAMSNWLSAWGWYFLLFFIFLSLLGFIFSRTERGKLLMAKGKRKIPFLRTLDRDLQSAQFAGLMALFYESNVNLLHFLRIMAEGTDNVWQRDVYLEIHRSVQGGESVHSAFEKTSYFSPILIGMLRIGEESGQLSSVMGSISSYLDMEAELKLRRAVTILEPALIIGMSFLVGFIVLSITMPMFEMIHLYEF